jgi:hypothetical protein
MTPFTAGFMSVCLALIALEIAVMMAAVVYLAVRVQKAAESVEVLAYRVEESVSNVTSSLTSGWMKALTAGASLLTGAWRGRQRHQED